MFEEMVVVGLDPGLRYTGYAAAVGSERGVAVREVGVLRVPGGTWGARLREVYRDAAALLADLRPDRVALEDVFAHARHPRTAVHVAHVRGVLYLAAAAAGVPVESLPPAAVKRAVCGNGRAPKAQVQAAVRSLLGLFGELDPHAADALALAATALARAGYRLGPEGKR